MLLHLILNLQEELRPFLSLPKVIDGLFSLAKMLFAIDIEPADGLAPVIYFIYFIYLLPLIWTLKISFVMLEVTLQVWNEDVKLYCVKDSYGAPMAYFYFDPYSRPSEKHGGAWVSMVVGRSRALSRDGTSSRLPIVHIVCNQTPPLDGKPSLMTFREVWHITHCIWGEIILIPALIV